MEENENGYEQHREDKENRSRRWLQWTHQQWKGEEQSRHQDYHH
jgi:hypothetical protein